jgi:hypothetical protein
MLLRAQQFLEPLHEENKSRAARLDPVARASRPECSISRIDSLNVGARRIVGVHSEAAGGHARLAVALSGYVVPGPDYFEWA